MMTRLKEKAVNMREAIVDHMGDDVTFTKLDFCLMGAVLFLAGICIGLLTAPWTHGVSICSNNGNNNGHNSSSNVHTDLKADEDSEEFED